MNDNYDVGIYCRLSRDDNNGHLESMSIVNQRQVLMDYVEEKGWNLKECYVDDGWSGTNFERPSFKRMIHDAENGKINCIITKDLSRLGRNYVQAGYYTDEFFVEHNIRFIAVNDGIDTIKEDNDIAAFHHVLNEIYPKQVSKKVRQVKKKSAQQGKFMGSQAPYGYMKSPQDKHILIVDEEAAIIVRRLFSEFANGISARFIADKLNAEKINSPRFYHYEKIGQVSPYSSDKNVWGSSSILQILRNQVYIGNMVQGKRQVVSFKTKKRRQVNPDNWIVVENTHEPIVDRAIWDRVQEILARNRNPKRTKSQEVGMFAGIVQCEDCGATLAYMRKKLKCGYKGFYRCCKYNNNGSKTCTPHYIEERNLCEFVVNDIRKYAQLAASEKQVIANKLYNSLKKSNASEEKVLRTNIENIEKRLSVITSTLKNLYVDKCSGAIPENVFFDLMNDFKKEQDELEKQLPVLRKELGESSETKSEINSWLSVISQYTELETLNRGIVMELINRIVVSERTKINDEWYQTIEIEYRFIGKLLNDKKPLNDCTKREDIA